jgi:hypothetical protein
MQYVAGSADFIVGAKESKIIPGSTSQKIIYTGHITATIGNPEPTPKEQFAMLWATFPDIKYLGIKIDNLIEEVKPYIQKRDPKSNWLRCEFLEDN